MRIRPAVDRASLYAYISTLHVDYACVEMAGGVSGALRKGCGVI